jgi:nitroreductase
LAAWGQSQSISALVIADGQTSTEEWAVIPHADALHQILSAGVQAPSAENIHYFWLEVGPQTVILHATDYASWSLRPDKKMLALMSFGAVVENITLRAQALGFMTHASWQFDSSRVLELSWQSATPVADPLNEAISTRHTNRRFYQRAPLASGMLEQILAAGNSVPGAGVHWLAHGPPRSLALSLIRIAETERFRRSGLHHEMFSAIRFERGWEGTVLEGLPPAALQVEFPMRWPFAWLRRWGLMRAADAVGAHLALGLRSGYLLCATAPHIGLVMSNAPDVDTAHMRAGRALERLWLAAEHHGLSLQPMAAATVLVQQISGLHWVSAATQKRLFEGLQALSGQFGVDNLGARPCMLFRLGRASAPTAVAGRRPLEHFLNPPLSPPLARVSR